MPEATTKEAEVLALAEKLVPPEGADAWAWNQALMELGALVCTARKPRCQLCPVGDDCRARGRIEADLAGVPRKKAGEAPPTYRYEDTYRFLRGRVLARLREGPQEGLSLRELGAALHEGFADEDLPWILGVVRSLERDGLAALDWQAPPRDRAGTVAEARPAYGTQSEEAPDDALPSGETLVRLPQG